MKNNTAEGSINVVYPYRIEVKVKDVTGSEQLAKLHEGDDAAFMQAYSVGLGLFDAAGAGERGTEFDLSDTVILIEEHYYQLDMALYDKDGNLITLTDNLLFESLNLDPAYIEVIRTNKIRSQVVVKTKIIAGDDRVAMNTAHRLAKINAHAIEEKFAQFEMQRLS